MEEYLCCRIFISFIMFHRIGDTVLANNRTFVLDTSQEISKNCFTHSSTRFLFSLTILYRAMLIFAGRINYQYMLYKLFKC